jgi:hypothetical protein
LARLRGHRGRGGRGAEIRIAAARLSTVRALALGHPAIAFARSGARPALNGEVFDALMQVARTDYRSFVRTLCQLTQHAYDDEMAERYMERVPQEIAFAYLEQMLSSIDAEQLEPTLRDLGLPMLLVEHHGCIAWTHESFEDAVAAFPEATTASVEIKPSCDPSSPRSSRGSASGYQTAREPRPSRGG